MNCNSGTWWRAFAVCPPLVRYRLAGAHDVPRPTDGHRAELLAVVMSLCVAGIEVKVCHSSGIGRPVSIA